MFPFLDPGLGPLLGSAIGIDAQINSALGLIEKDDDGSLILKIDDVEEVTWNTDSSIGTEGEWDPESVEEILDGVGGDSKQKATISATVDGETKLIDVLISEPDYDEDSDDFSFKINPVEGVDDEQPDPITGLIGKSLYDFRMNIDNPEVSKGRIFLSSFYRSYSDTQMMMQKAALKSAGYDVPTIIRSHENFDAYPEWPFGDHKVRPDSEYRDSHIAAVVHGTPISVYQEIKRVRDSQWNGPIIVVSVEADTVFKYETKRAGAYAYVGMPWYSHKLTSVVEKAIEQWYGI